MPLLNPTTPLMPSDAVGPLTPSGTPFEPSLITVMGVAGSMTVTTAAGRSISFANVASGVTLPVLCVAVTAAAATDIFRSF